MNLGVWIRKQHVHHSGNTSGNWIDHSYQLSFSPCSTEYAVQLHSRGSMPRSQSLNESKEPIR